MFGILYTLTGDIIQVPLKYLVSAYARLKETKHTRYIIVSIQILLRSFSHFCILDTLPLQPSTLW